MYEINIFDRSDECAAPACVHISQTGGVKFTTKPRRNSIYAKIHVACTQALIDKTQNDNSFTSFVSSFLPAAKHNITFFVVTSFHVFGNAKCLQVVKWLEIKSRHFTSSWRFGPTINISVHNYARGLEREVVSVMFVCFTHYVTFSFKYLFKYEIEALQV